VEAEPKSFSAVPFGDITFHCKCIYSRPAQPPARESFSCGPWELFSVAEYGAKKRLQVIVIPEFLPNYNEIK